MQTNTDKQSSNGKQGDTDNQADNPKRIDEVKVTSPELPINKTKNLSKLVVREYNDQVNELIDNYNEGLIYPTEMAWRILAIHGEFASFGLNPERCNHTCPVCNKQ